MKLIKIPQADRVFFQTIADASYTNPFSEKRESLDRQIAGLTESDTKGLSWPQIVPAVIHKVHSKLAELDHQIPGQPASIDHFNPEDRELMKYVFLFEVFHRFALDFDTLIRKQEKNPDKSLPVPFAARTFEHLAARGFTPAQLARSFALFYQIRRAFYFINQGLVGRSACMRKLRMDLWNNIFTQDIRGYEQYLWDKMEDFATLIEGPTGSGKGAAAAAIGKSGWIPFDTAANAFQYSFTNLFVAANLSQYAPTLLESELFGHTRGAFTGAVTDHDGLFGLCRPHGTIFLDEISEVAPQVQVKLLKVLEERTFTPVGSHKPRRFFGRVVAATNRPTEELRRTGAFREDFYYRLCADCIQMPSLAQRIEENPDELTELVEHFSVLITGQDIPELSEKVLDVIQKRLGRDYPWPGNVRELAQCIRRVILKEDYQPQVPRPTTQIQEFLNGVQQANYSADELLNQYCKWLYTKYPSYQDVARITGIDWRTAKKRIEQK